MNGSRHLFANMDFQPGVASMTDKTTKLILAAIAAGLWANLFMPFLRPIEAVAQYESDSILRKMDVRVTNLDANVDRLLRGACSNSKLCQ